MPALAPLAIVAASVGVAAAEPLRAITLTVAAPGTVNGDVDGNGDGCTQHDATTWSCASLSGALKKAPTFTNGAVTVRFNFVFRATQPLELRAGEAPSTLVLQGGDNAAIDGGGASGLLRIIGGSAAVRCRSRIVPRARRGAADAAAATHPSPHAPIQRASDGEVEKGSNSSASSSLPLLPSDAMTAHGSPPSVSTYLCRCQLTRCGLPTAGCRTSTISYYYL